MSRAPLFLTICLLAVPAFAQDSQPTDPTPPTSMETDPEPTSLPIEADEVTPPDAPAHAVALTCDQTAQTLEGEPGTTFRGVCPLDCTQATVWGTDLYTDDSAICVAAIHSGVLTTAGGPVIVTILEGQSAYPSSWQNDIQSQTWREWNRSFQVTLDLDNWEPLVEE